MSQKPAILMKIDDQDGRDNPAKDIPTLGYKVRATADLSKEFLGQFSGHQKILSKEAIELLLIHFAKGNTRELKNLMSRIAIQINYRVIYGSQIRQSIKYQLIVKNTTPSSMIRKVTFSQQPVEFAQHMRQYQD
jgi:DNA-binding NtrC family response regulator